VARDKGLCSGCIQSIMTVVILVGLPGSGKSTVGKHLARKLAFCFVDSDHAIESRLGCSIREYFEREGEAKFRDLEQAVVSDLATGQAASLAHCPEQTRQRGLVLSTGGGTVLREANRQVLRASGRVVYLRASPQEIYRRLRHDRTRPLLQVNDPLQKLRDLHADRDALYRDCAHMVIETGRPTVSGLVNAIVQELGLAPDVQALH
jgi:shikimate kinase